MKHPAQFSVIGGQSDILRVKLFDGLDKGAGHALIIQGQGAVRQGDDQLGKNRRNILRDKAKLALAAAVFHGEGNAMQLAYPLQRTANNADILFFAPVGNIGNYPGVMDITNNIDGHGWIGLANPDQAIIRNNHTLLQRSANRLGKKS